MKKVLFYTDTPNIGGAEKHMLLLAKHLKKLKIDVFLAYGSYSKINQMKNEFDKICKKVFILKTKNKHDPRHYFQLNKLLKEEEFDLIHIHLWNPGAGRYAFFASSKNKVPIVSTEHDPFELTGIKKWIKQICLKKTKKMILISQANISLLENYYKVPRQKTRHIANGIELDEFTKKGEKAILPNVQKTVISCIAELHPRKGHKMLFEAYRKLGERKEDISLILIGAGPSENELKKIAKPFKNISFLGWRNDIPAILKASDIFILPSPNEAFGQVIIEAMASDVPVIGINNGGPKEIVDDGKTGYLIKNKDSQEMALKITELMDNPEKRKAIIKQAKEKVTKMYSVERMAKETIFTYNEVKKPTL